MCHDNARSVRAETPGDGRRANGGHAGGSPPASSSLEYFQNVVEEGEGRKFELAKCGCNCWYCEDCCERMGYNLRAELIEVLETFTGIMMLTLTVDPTLFASPREAYEHVMDNRGLSELIRELHRRGHLHSKRFFYVVEFQRETEQPHFHMLIDATFVPKDEIEELWSRLRPEDAGPVEPGRPGIRDRPLLRARVRGGSRARREVRDEVPREDAGAWVAVVGYGHGRRSSCTSLRHEPAILESRAQAVPEDRQDAGAQPSKLCRPYRGLRGHLQSL
jgi:hypothetical protein